MDKEKIDEIYRENAQMIYKYLCGLTGDSGLAEELTQETFFQAVKGIEKFRGDCKISVWLCGIAKNLWYKELKKEAGTELIRWMIRYLPMKMLKIEVWIIWKR